MKESSFTKSRSDNAFSKHRRVAESSDVFNPCKKKEKQKTLEEQFEDNDWKIIVPR
jgi:hypothetical protein